MERKAREGDRAAQYILGFVLLSEAAGMAGELGAGGRSPKADVGSRLPTILLLSSSHPPLIHLTSTSLPTPHLIA